MLRTGLCLGISKKHVRAGRILQIDYPQQTMDFTSQTPEDYGFVVYRTGATATYRDSDGLIKVAPANTSRIDYDKDGNCLGFFREQGSTNIVTQSQDLTTTAGWAHTRLSTPSVNVPSIIDGINWFDMIPTSVSGTHSIKTNLTGLTDGNTYAISFYAKAGSENTITGRLNFYNPGLTLFGFAQFTADLSNGTISSVTPLYTTIDYLEMEDMGGGVYRVKAVVTLAAGFTITSPNLTIYARDNTSFAGDDITVALYLTGVQIENSVYASSYIPTSGATSARGNDVAFLYSLDTKEYFNEVNGALIAHTRSQPPHGHVHSSHSIMYMSNNSSGTVRYNDQIATSYLAGAYARTNTAFNSYTATAGRFAKTNGFRPIGMNWVNDSHVTLLANAGQELQSIDITSGAVEGITQLALGSSSNGGYNFFSGWIKRLDWYTSVPDRDLWMKNSFGTRIGATDRAAIGGGQSNMQLISNTQGELNLLSTMDAYLGIENNKRNWFINGGIGGTATNTWVSGGSSYLTWVERAQAAKSAGIQIPFILWDQGENDIGGPYDKDEFKTVYLSIFQNMRGIVGNVPVIIIPLGIMENIPNSAANNASAWEHRQAYQELAAEYDWIHLAPEKFIWTRGDTVHLDSEGYGNSMARVSRTAMNAIGETVTGGLYGPVITGATRSGTWVDVTISHDGGTDFTPTTGIEGFKFYDDGVEIALTAAQRLNATTIRLYLSSTPTGVETVEYCTGLIYGADATKLVRDNDTYPLPLRSRKITL